MYGPAQGVRVRVVVGGTLEGSDEPASGNRNEFLSPLSDSHYSSYLPNSCSRLEVFLCNTQILVSKRQTGYWL